MTEKDDIIAKINNTDKPLYRRVGFGFKGAEWHKASKASLITSLKSGYYAHYDICDIKDGWGINFYTDNDML